MFEALREACGAWALTNRTVTRRVNEIKSGGETAKEHHRAGRTASTTDFNIELVREPLKSDKILPCEEIGDKCVGSIHTIIRNHLGMRKFPPVGYPIAWRPTRLNVVWKSQPLIFHGSIWGVKTFYLGLLLLIKRGWGHMSQSWRDNLLIRILQAHRGLLSFCEYRNNWRLLWALLTVFGVLSLPVKLL